MIQNRTKVHTYEYKKATYQVRASIESSHIIEMIDMLIDVMIVTRTTDLRTAKLTSAVRRRRKAHHLLS